MLARVGIAPVRSEAEVDEVNFDIFEEILAIILVIGWLWKVAALSAVIVVKEYVVRFQVIEHEAAVVN